jgi:hypothetical protein
MFLEPNRWSEINDKRKRFIANAALAVGNDEGMHVRRHCSLVSARSNYDVVLELFS